MSIEDEVTSAFRSDGIEIVGFAAAETAPRAKAQFVDWLSLGFHGTMEYLESHVDSKYSPDSLLSGARSVIMTATNYHQSHTSSGGCSPITDEADSEPQGRVSVYAWGRDYHKTIGKRLARIGKRFAERYPGERFRPFVDILPIAERYYAEKAGIGFIGKNTLLITRRFGSWVFLGGMLTTLDLAPTKVESMKADSTTQIESTTPEGNSAVTRCPSGCTRCIDACPTKALFAPHRIDASRCVSYLTIEHSGNVANELARATGGWIFGCDLCQSVCPFNQKTAETRERDFTNWIAGPSIPLGEIDVMSRREQFVDRFAGSPVMRAGIEGIKRNAEVVRRNRNPYNRIR